MRYSQNINRIFTFLILFFLLQIMFNGCKEGENQESSDRSAPRVTDTKIAVYSNDTNNLSLQWKRAVDESTLYDQIIYSLYFSSDASIDSLEKIATHGTRLLHTAVAGALGTQLGEVDVTSLLVTNNFQKNRFDTRSNSFNGETLDPGGEHSYMTLKIKGLSPATNYYFNIVAEDERGNQTLYTMVSYTTKTVASLEINFTPPDGSYDQDQFVSISAIPSEGTTIYFSTNPSADKNAFNPYSADLFLQGQETEVVAMTVRAYATNLFYPDSEIISSSYVIDYNKVSTLKFDPTPDTYNSAQWVTISTTTLDADIYYTTNGSVPTVQSMLYTGPVEIADVPNPNFVTLRAIAVKIGQNNSNIRTGEYNVVLDQVKAPTFSPAVGGIIVVGATIPVLGFSTETAGAEIYYTLDGTIPTESSTKFTSDITMDTQKLWSVRIRAFKSGMAPSTTVSNGYDLIPTPPQMYRQSTPPCGFYCYNSVDISMDTPTLGTEIRYTLNNTEATGDSFLFSTPFTVESYTILRAKVLHPVFGYSEEFQASIIFVIADPVVTPSVPWNSIYSAACPISIQIDSSTDGLEYQWKKWQINGPPAIDPLPPNIDLPGNTFDFTHENTTDVVRILIYRRNPMWGMGWLATSYGYRCTSI